MSVLTSLTNLLEFIENYWSAVVILIGVILGLYKKIKDYLDLSTEEKIEAAKLQVQEAILQMITAAELEYQEYESAGAIKRSEVIAQIYEKWPVLEKVADQEALITWLDELIDNALVTLREVIAINEEAESDGLQTTEEE